MPHIAVTLSSLRALAVLLLLSAGLVACNDGSIGGDDSDDGQAPPDNGPTASFATSGPAEAGSAQSFDAGAATGDGLSYDWDFGDGATGAGVQTTHTFAQAGTYTVSLTVTEGDGDTDSATQSLQIAPASSAAPSADFSVSGPGEARQAQSFDAGASTGSDLSYDWAFGDGDLGGGGRIAHVYDAAGSYTVTLTVTDGSGASDSATRDVTIAAAPQPTATDADIAGKITDVAGNDLAGVSVSLVAADTLVGGAREAATDANGEATLAGMPTDVAFVLALSKDGYADQYVRTIIPDGATDARFAAAMIARGGTQTLSDAEKGGSVDGTAGTRIELPPGALVDGEGDPVSGDVDVTLTPVDVGDDAALGAFPGSFAAFDRDGDSGLLMSFGVAEFLLAQGGETLQIAAGEQATLTVPIYVDAYRNGDPVASGDSIPFWSLDETTGQWIQEGTGTVVEAPASPTGLAFQITVSHLSWWNCDLSADPGLVTPSFTNAAGGDPFDDNDSVAVTGRAQSGPSSVGSTNLLGNNGRDGGPSRTLAVPPSVPVELLASARNGTLVGAKTIQLDPGATQSVEIVLDVPGGGQGETITLPYDNQGAIDPADEVDRYSFTGQSDRVLRIRAGSSGNSNLEGRVTLTGPGGNTLGSSEFTGTHGFNGDALVLAELPADGEYTITLDGTDNEPGGYRVTADTLQKVALDENLTGTVPSDGGETARAFRGEAGTVIGVTNVSRDDIRLEVRDFEGRTIAADAGLSYDDGILAELPADGFYMLTLDDSVINGEASAFRTAVATIETPQTLALDSGGRASASGDIQVYGDREFYQFTAAAGDGFYAALSQAAGDALTSNATRIDIYRPEGTPYWEADRLTGGDRTGNLDDSAHLQDLGLSLPGGGSPETFLVAVSAPYDNDGEELGGYALQLDIAPAQSSLLVDDDLAQCPGADTHSLHAAGYAVTEGGTLDVCAGRYAEHQPIVAAKGDYSIVGRDRDGVVLGTEETGEEIVRGDHRNNDGAIALESLTVQTRSDRIATFVSGASHVTLESAPNASAPAGGLYVNTDGALIDDVDLTTGGAVALSVYAADDVVVRNSRIAGDGGRVEFQFSNDLLVENNEFDLRNTSGTPFYFDSGSGLRLLDNRITTTPARDENYGDRPLIQIEDEGDGATGTIVRGNDIETGHGGLRLDARDAGASFTVENNRIAGTPERGSLLLEAAITNTNAENAVDITVRNNVFDGIALTGGLTFSRPDLFTSVDVINNSLRGPADGFNPNEDAAMVEFTSSSNTLPPAFPVRLVNNVLQGLLASRDDTAVLIEPGVTIDADNNLFHELATTYRDGDTSTGGNDIVGQDPLFANDLLEVAGTSPAVDAGAEPVDYGPVPGEDYDGTPRPQGANWDIGAHEHTP